MAYKLALVIASCLIVSACAIPCACTNPQEQPPEQSTMKPADVA